MLRIQITINAIFIIALIFINFALISFNGPCQKVAMAFLVQSPIFGFLVADVYTSIIEMVTDVTLDKRFDVTLCIGASSLVSFIFLVCVA